MSKSLGNFHTVASLREAGYRPSAIRFLLLSGHHRQQLNFTLEGLDRAAKSVDRLHSFSRRLEEASAGFVGEGDTPSSAGAGSEEADAEELAIRWRIAFERALDDDLNVADGMAATFDMVREGNSMLDSAADPESASAIAGALLPSIVAFDRVFGVLALRGREELSADAGLAGWVESQLAARTRARERRDFAEADRIRDEIIARGVLIEDTPDGPRWRLREPAE